MLVATATPAVIASPLTIVRAKSISDDQFDAKSPLGTILDEHLLLSLLAKARR
jgi:hypothetical protein